MDEDVKHPFPIPVRRAFHIFGTVQGVNYRRAAQSEARRLGLTGLVRNEADGSVYTEVQGLPDTVGTFLRWCRKGPPHARVEKVETRDLTLRRGGAEEGFDIHYG
jgi:acylphosphatase